MKTILMMAVVFALIGCAKKDSVEEQDTSFIRVPSGDSATTCMVETTKVTGKNEKAHVDTTCR